MLYIAAPEGLTMSFAGMVPWNNCGSCGGSPAMAGSPGTALYGVRSGTIGTNVPPTVTPVPPGPVPTGSVGDDALAVTVRLPTVHDSDGVSSVGMNAPL